MKLAKLVLFSVLIGIVVFLAVWVFSGPAEILKVLESVNYSLLGLAFFFHFLAMVAISTRWKFVIEKSGLKVRTWKLFMITLAGTAISNITPSARMGGEPVRAYFLNKEAKTTTKLSFATIITERLFDGITFTALILFVILFSLKRFELPSWVDAMLIIAFGISVATIVMMTFLSVNRSAARAFSGMLFRKSGWITRRFPNIANLEKKVVEDSDLYTTNSRHLMGQKDLWAYGVLLTLLVWVFDIFRTYFIFLALGIEVPFAVIFAAISISALMGSLPILPGGIGLMESTMILIYSSSGINLAIAGMSTILDRLISFWMFTFIGLVAAYYLGIKHYKGEKK